MNYALFDTFLVMIVIDLGSSLLKIVFTGCEGHPEAIALDPQLVSDVSAQQISSRMDEYGNDALRSAWVEVEGQTYAAGEFAIDLSGRQYHELGKWQDLLPRVLIILGLISHRLQRTEGFQAQIALCMPRDEVKPPDRESRISAIIAAAQHFQFRGQMLECEIDIKVVTEGAGLFATQAVNLERQGVNPSSATIPVLMGGERNTSLLVYRSGKINPSLSSSDGNGFYKFADQVRKSAGVPIGLSELIRAIAQGQHKLRIAGNERIDIADFVTDVLEGYTSAIRKYLKAKLPSEDIYLIAGGGAVSLIWNQLDPWFSALEIPATYIGTIMEQELKHLLSQHPSEFDLIRSPGLLIRFADALGIYKSMAARQPQKPIKKITAAR
ncbi:ParM/StbA family protein [Leptolyngbya sp. FACHB-16]|uniref:ParM/StbA family protein n=1 Tax=unclassified Leptolyngbya TaxID=2650499 RepID=UPI001688C0CA|nr:ParM/StbA family protein [Leptolyngbya sp. FACHB-16]MBD2154524.1 ParM/StbA family protein [Leptolyngbya sp. FACHB-16]